ncbi:mechanosensitive ion channel family protein [Aliterella atlantica]|uniref:mechanosensitive ion channel family protein n=1 Tax=Aliterella atlantica TaxID=1827278 RepID=UPI001F2938A7|nr:mechanosensitive ion channel family protein [Aliterella atlantica]
MTSLTIVVARIGLTQDTSLTPAIAQTTTASPQSTNPDSIPSDGFYFADILVRGQPVFQVGSLSNLSARSRAAIINRRIASVLAQSESGEAVTVEPDTTRGIALLQVNNRVLMTVTGQDAQDFNTSVEALARQWADALNSAFEQQPFVIDVGQRLWSTLRSFQRDTISNLPSLIGALLALLLTWLVARSLRRLTLVGTRHWQGDDNAKILVSRVVYGGVWVVGTIITLGVLGLEFTTLLGTLGLTSVVIGFSLRDVLSNYFSGVILLASRPFRLGDQIVIKEFEGTVRQIELRATTLVTYDGRVVYIPNQEVFSAVITNNTVSGKRRTSVTVGITYDTDINTAKKIIIDTVLKVTGVEPEPKPITLVRELGTGTVNLEVLFWANSQRLPFIEMTSEVTQAIKESLQQAEIKFIAIPQIKVIQLTDNIHRTDNSDRRETNIEQSN